MSPGVHLLGEETLVQKTILKVALGERVFQQFPGDGLPAYVGPDDAFAVDEALDDWDDVGVLCSDVDDEGAF